MDRVTHHDAHFLSIQIDPSGRTAAFNLSALYEFTGNYIKDAHFRWPAARKG
jgi:hypothetical protein